MGHSDGFTLVKGISSYGMSKMRKRANIDESKISNFSDMTKTQTSMVAVASYHGGDKRNRNNKKKMNHTVEPQLHSRHRIRDEDTDLDRQQEGAGSELPAAHNQASSFYTQATLPAAEDYKITKQSGRQDSGRRDRDRERDDEASKGPTFPKLKPQKKFLQTMGNLNSGLDANKINTTTEHFMKNKHGIHITEKIHTTMNNKRKKKIHHQAGGEGDMKNGDINMMAGKAPVEEGRAAYRQPIVGYDSSSDSSYLHIP